MYMQARYYDPVIGRFYSNDPVDAISHLGRQGGIHGFNRYAYANNNPYKYIDPDGRETRLMTEAHHLDMDVAKGNMTEQERVDVSVAQFEGIVGAVGALKVGALAIKQGLKQYAKSLVKRNGNKIV
jgi:RHS repeat-associated protein